MGVEGVYIPIYTHAHTYNIKVGGVFSITNAKAIENTNWDAGVVSADVLQGEITRALASVECFPELVEFVKSAILT